MLAAVPALLALASCAGPFSALDPAGPAARQIAWLWWAMFWGASAIFVLVAVLFALACLRPGVIARWNGTRWIVGGGLVMPGIVLAALMVAAFGFGERLIARPGADQPLRVSARAEQWVWRFGYPEGPDSLVSDVLHIPAGVPVDIVVTTSDVIHGFWIPRLGGKIDAIPGHENVVRLQADRPGTYRGLCAEFCGNGHTHMLFEVVAHPRQDYAAALARLQAGGGGE